MMGHHPVGRLDSEVTHAQWLTDLVLRFQDIIVLHVHGHTHKDGVTLVSKTLPQGAFRNFIVIKTISCCKARWHAKLVFVLFICFIYGIVLWWKT